jgi:beta-N-acetylhexosaminidase
MRDLLRDELGFAGLLISDALDMQAISQGAGQIIDAIAAVRAGVDLLLLAADPEAQARVYEGLRLALVRGLLDEEELQSSARRVLALKDGLATQAQPSLEVVGCADHQELEREVARRAVTLVRDRTGLLPLNLPAEARVAAIMPKPQDLTPADTSSLLPASLAPALRRYGRRVDSFLVAHAPSPVDITVLKEAAATYDLLVVGTASAQLSPEQGAMVRELLALGVPTVTVALRTPYDLLVYPQADTHVCTFSLQPCAMDALAAALWGQSSFHGRLPVTLPGLYPLGHGMTTDGA